MIRMSLLAFLTIASFLPLSLLAVDADSQPCDKPSPVRTLMLVGGVHHDYDNLSASLANRLNKQGILCDVITDLNRFAALVPQDYDVLIINTCLEKGLAVEQQKAIVSLVHEGVGLVAVHCALWSFQDWPEWRKMIGGLVLKHDPFGEFVVSIVDRRHPIAMNVPEEFKVTDEAYWVEQRTPDIHTIAQTTAKHGGRNTLEPQAWTTRYAGGRIFVTTLGHDARVQEHPAFLQLLTNGVQWAAQRVGPPTMLSELERKEGFVPLFDSKTLKGWHYNPDCWSVKDGIIIGKSSPPGLVKNSFAITDKPYGDFVLRFSTKLPKGNSGVQFRSQELDNYEVAGYQADTVVGGWGNLHEQNGRARLVDGWKGKGEFAVNPKDWVDMEVEAKGPHIIIRTNGVVTADYAEAAADKPKSGIIALQLHRGDPMEVYFTNIRIKAD